jgi:glycosyltransferase involved in cell wall biosynthesis
MVVTHWTGDARPSVSPYLASICKATHVTFASSFGGLEQFKAAGARRAEYLQIGLDWAEDVMGEPDWVPPFRVPDVVFVGGYYSHFPGAAQRVEAVRALQEAGIDVGIVGGAWPAGFPVVGKCEVKQQHHVWKRAKVALNVNNFNNIVGYYSDRQLIAMASGTPVVCYAIPGLGLEFEHGKHMLSYRTNEELVSAVKMLLSDEATARRIGRAGRAEVIKNHTWFNRILQAIPIVEEIQAAL